MVSDFTTEEELRSAWCTAEEVILEAQEEPACVDSVATLAAAILVSKRLEEIAELLKRCGGAQ